MVPCAYLRVYEPLDAFPAAERGRWGRYVAAGRGVSVGVALRVESRAAAERLVSGRPPAPPEVALVRRVGRRVHVCPLDLPQRHAVALVSFRDSVPVPAMSAFASRAETDAAVRTVTRLRRPPHIRESPWEVPLRWFAGFTPDERHFVPPTAGREASLVYLTDARTALERLDRAIGVVESAVDRGDEIVELLGEFVDWLAYFHDDSILELDYGGLASFLPPADLATDFSCEEVWASIASLERGDATAAAAAYEAVVGRWELLRIRSSVN